MRLAMVANRFPKYSETFVVAKFLGLLERGWDAHVVCKTSDEGAWEMFPQLAEGGAHAGRVHPASRPTEMIRELGPAVVHFEFGYLARGLGDVKEAGGRIVVSFRGTDLNAPKPSDAENYSDIWRHADALHVLSADLWKRARRRGCPEDKPHAVISPAVDSSFFHAPDRTYEAGIGRPGRPLRILSVGRLVWHKGYDYALHAVRELERRGVRCEYRVIGDGEHRIPVDFAVDEFGLQDIVTILGPQPRASIVESMAWADVLLHAGLYEGFCNAVLEAQSMALPVVCTRIGGVLENVVDGETAIAVPVRDSLALADAMERLARNAGLRRALGTAGRKRATSKFSVARQIEAFDRLYRSVLPADAESFPVPSRDRATSARGTPRPPAPEPAPSALAGRTQAIAIAPAPSTNGPSGAVPARATLQGAQSVAEIVASLTPSGATLITISKGDEALVCFRDRRGWHFPRSESGAYAGYYPGTGEEAIAHLEHLRELGGDYLVIPAAAFWWLDHYAAFAAHLLTRYRLVAWVRGTCMVFDLGGSPEAAGATAVAGLGLALSER